MYLIEPIRNGEWIYNQGLLMAIQSYARDHLFLDCLLYTSPSPRD